MKPVKLFVVLNGDTEGRNLQNLLEAEFGPIDHRMSLIPIGRVLLSFDRLVDVEEMPECNRKVSELAPGSRSGFVQNHRVVLSSTELLQFKSGEIQLPEFAGKDVLIFFHEARRRFRDQLRTMCLLRQKR